MNEDGLHPNWAALATTTFQFKKFVRATEPDNPVRVSSREHNRDDANGEATKQFYDQILSDENLARRKPKLENAKVETVDLSDDDDVEFVDQDANKKMLVFIQNEDLDSLRNLRNCDYNFKDDYGWSPLEIAAVGGNCDIVKFLLDKDAKIYNHERLNNILKKKELEEVKNLIESYNEDVIDLSDEEVILELCDDCGEMFDKDKEAAHKATIIHQLSLKEEDGSKKRNPGFLLTEGNRGFKMMKRSGWDGVSGLGDESQGKLFPVKTVFKHDRRGIDIGDKKKMRITHFGPKDTESVAHRRKRKPFNEKKLKQKKTVKRGSNSFSVCVSKDQMIREDMGDL